VANYNPFKPRDRSHYEHFRSYHHSIYQYVEPTSVTPFAVPVRERALHALVVILCRFWGDADLRARPNHPPDAALVERIKETIRERVLAADEDEWPATAVQIDAIVRRWSEAPPPRYGDFGPPPKKCRSCIRRGASGTPSGPTSGRRTPLQAPCEMLTPVVPRVR
jgi:hypothetical protein